jgi:hypothetical protein
MPDWEDPFWWENRYSPMQQPASNPQPPSILEMQNISNMNLPNVDATI